VPADVPVTVVGLGSNLLVRDGGVPGVVIRLGREFAGIAVEDDRVRAGAGALDVNVAIAARDAGKAGLEFLSGIPGTIGGALRMNAGAYGGEIKDVLIEAEAIDGRGRLRRLALADFGFTYRHSSLPDDTLFLSATLRCRDGDRDEIARRMVEIDAQRKASQPKTRTGGSTFKNPDGRKAWQLIDAAGCRGLRIGGASVSELHCNFLISAAGATAADIEALGEEVRRRVRETSGVELEWEIIRIGVPSEGQER
jgi:UDP-N-acetylmuramate dehydrogenase